MIFAAVVGVLVAWVILIYNGLVKRRNDYTNAFAQIDVQLTRRYDLIPNLVETAKKFMAHEKETLEAVISARNQALKIQVDLSKGLDPEKIEQLSLIESQLSSGLGRLMAVSENYPDLKSDGQMQALSEELTSTENRVAFARQAFNDAVTQYNNQREVFPSNLIAGQFGFSKAALLKLPEAVTRSAPKISFE